MNNIKSWQIFNEGIGSDILNRFGEFKDFISKYLSVDKITKIKNLYNIVESEFRGSNYSEVVNKVNNKFNCDIKMEEVKKIMEVIGESEYKYESRRSSKIIFLLAMIVVWFGIQGVFYPYTYKKQVPEMIQYLEDSGYEKIKPIGYGSYMAPSYEFEVTNRNGKKEKVFVSITHGNYTLRFNKISPIVE